MPPSSLHGARSPQPIRNDRAMDIERCVFHARSSRNASADELTSLSALAASDPDAYADALSKYDDTPERRRLRDTWIPLVEAAWTDVVFLSPIRPHAIWRAWRSVAGVELPSLEFWAIPVDEIGHSVVFDRQITATGEPIDQREVRAVDAKTYRSSRDTTNANLQWITSLARSNKRGAWFNGTPHVLTRGPVPLNSAVVIDWRNP